jgi:aspartate racemase
MRTASRPRCLGLIGGLGVGATVHYYRTLAKAHALRGVDLRLVMEHVDTRPVFEFMQSGDREGLAQFLADSIGRLRAAGAEVAAVPAVAPHLCVRELVAISPLPVVNLLHAVADTVRASGIRRAAIFGTGLVMQTGVFKTLGSVELVVPAAAQVDYIHQTYLDLAMSGERSEEHYRGLTALAHALLRDGAEAIILAGTDLSVVFSRTPRR